jgi:hypothetical protein
LTGKLSSVENVVLYFSKESLPVKKLSSQDNEISSASAQGQLRQEKKTVGLWDF